MPIGCWLPLTGGKDENFHHAYPTFHQVQWLPRFGAPDCDAALEVPTVAAYAVLCRRRLAFPAVPTSRERGYTTRSRLGDTLVGRQEQRTN